MAWGSPIDNLKPYFFAGFVTSVLLFFGPLIPFLLGQGDLYNSVSDAWERGLFYALFYSSNSKLGEFITTQLFLIAIVTISLAGFLKQFSKKELPEGDINRMGAVSLMFCLIVILIGLNANLLEFEGICCDSVFLEGCNDGCSNSIYRVIGSYEVFIGICNFIAKFILQIKIHRER